MTSVYLSLLMSVLHQEEMGGEEQHVFLCFEALEKETSLLRQTHLQDMNSPMQRGSIGTSGRVSWQIVLGGNAGWWHPKACKG